MCFVIDNCSSYFSGGLVKRSACFTSMYMLTYIRKNSKSKSSIVSCILCILLVVLGGQEGSFHVEGVSGSASKIVSQISDSTLVAITLLLAESKPEEKDVMVKMVMNLLNL